MPSPALYWHYQEVALARGDFFVLGKKIMQDQGLTNIKVSQNDVAGRTSTVHAVIAPIKKKDPPSPGPGLGTNAAATYILLFIAAGTDAKKVLDGLVKAWNKLKFL